MPGPLSRMSDEELIAEVQQDNEEAFTLLVGRFKDPLTNYVYRFVGDRDDANDIVQETFVRAYRSRRSYKPAARVSTWIYTIASNLAKSFLRRRRLRAIVRFSRTQEEQAPVFEIADTAPPADALVDASLREERIHKALSALPTKYREIVVLRDIQELAYEEIVAITGLAMGTVKSRINRGRRMLQEMLKDLRREPA